MNTTTLPVSEIFYSIDGEGARAGAPAIFIRLFGCNLDCTYCDSRYACKHEDGVIGFSDMTVEEIIQAVQAFEPCKCVTLTGGEPLIHEAACSLVSELRSRYYWVNIETNGSIDLTNFICNQPGRKSAMDYFFTMDWKSLSSGQSDKMLASNLSQLKSNDVLKFVVGSQEDLDQMLTVLDTYPEIDAQIYVSPVWGAITPDKIVEYLLEHNLVYVRVQLQLHKIIWNPNQRGV